MYSEKKQLEEHLLWDFIHIDKSVILSLEDEPEATESWSWKQLYFLSHCVVFMKMHALILVSGKYCKQ